MNPLDRVGEVFELEMMNPSCSSRSSKEGPRYFVKFETTKEAHDEFMAARELAGMVLSMHGSVTALNTPVAPAKPDETVCPNCDTVVPPGCRGTFVGDGEACKLWVPNRPSALAQQLHKDGYFRNYRLWQALEAADMYSHDAHVQYIRRMQCLFAPGRRTKGITTAWNIPCGGETKACGWIEADSARFPRVPLCAEHADRWWPAVDHMTSATAEERAHLNTIAVRLMAEQAEHILKSFLEIESLNDLTEESFAMWTAAINLEA